MQTKWLIRHAMSRVNQEIADNARGGFLAAGLSSEGYAGGYYDALCDVLLLLNNVLPSRRDYWPMPEELSQSRKV